MIRNKLIKFKIWKPTKPPSKGAQAYHLAVANSSWHKKNVNELIKKIEKKLKLEDIIVDFGAGTGSSAIYLLKHLKPKSKLILVDNSPSWLGYAYKILHKEEKSFFLLLPKKANGYLTLEKIVGKNTIDHVICANTVHLIPNIPEVFKGIYESLKKGGIFIFQSGNIKTNSRQMGILMIDDSVNQIHDQSINIIKIDKHFKKYKQNLDNKIEEQKSQRKFVFPDPRPVEFYVNALHSAGFTKEEVYFKKIKVKYDDWTNFLKVKRLQAGILPEVGGLEPTKQEEIDRDKIIYKASRELFKKLKKENPLANSSTFTAEWTYIYAEK